MLSFFRRKSDRSVKPDEPVAPAATRHARPRAPDPGKPAGTVLEPVPLPDVTEGNLDSDWALWEDSVAFQDSQMPSSFSALESVRERDQPKKEEGPDPFAHVRGRRS